MSEHTSVSGESRLVSRRHDLIQGIGGLVVGVGLLIPVFTGIITEEYEVIGIAIASAIALTKGSRANDRLMQDSYENQPQDRN